MMNSNAKLFNNQCATGNLLPVGNYFKKIGSALQGAPVNYGLRGIFTFCANYFLTH